MMTPNDIEAVWTIAPHARPEYKAVFDNAEAVLYKFSIVTPLRLVHFLAQILHETGGMTVENMEENLNYSADGLMKTWPRWFPTKDFAELYARQPRKIANYVYGVCLAKALGNRDEEDGWFFRGRGLPQITGRGNYEQVGERLGLDLAHEPELVVAPAHALEAAACVWHIRRANFAADRDDVVAVTKAINGGRIGLEDRKQWLAKVKRALSPEVKA